MAEESAGDRELMELWARGDLGAFAALVGRHQDSLLTHARSLLGRGGGAEDAVQETFLRLVKSPPGRAELGSLSGWLHQVLRRICLDQLRGERRRRERERQAAPSEAVAGGANEVETKDMRVAVEAGLARLSADQREVIALRLFGEKSYAEISAITGKPSGTVGWLLSEGLARLAAELGHWVGDGGAASRAGVR